MQKISLFLYLILASKLNFAQSVEVVSNGNTKLNSYPKNKASVFIYQKADTSKLQFVATYKTTGFDRFSTAGDVFLLIKKQAREDGANCFALRSFFYDSIKRPNIVIDAYYGSDDVVKAITSSYETNAVYIFSPEKIGRDSFSLKINDVKRTFSTGTYLKFVVKEGEKLNISKGGFTGTRAQIKFQKDKPPIYLMVFGGTHLGGGPLQAPGTIGVTYSTGEIKDMTDDYGQFLVQIQAQSE